MKTIGELSAVLAVRETNEPVERWAQRTYEMLVTQTLHLARFSDQIPPDLRDEYIDILRRTLEGLPDGESVTVSRALFEQVARLLGTDAVRDRLLVA